MEFKKYLFLLIAMAFLSACQEDLVSEPDFDILQPAAIDPAGGEWKTILGFDPREFTVAAPVDVQSPAYQAELQFLKEQTAQRTPADEELVRKWGSGAVLRWNRIARELVVKYNTPPPAGAPADPMKPFANPPYASRAYALLSVGQYDGLVTAWHYKFQFNRPAPAETDPSLVSLIPAEGLPAYPSEQGVIAAVSSAVLAQLFPAEKDYLEQQAQEHLQAMVKAGYHTESDLEAGWSIGQEIAARIIDRAKNDRFNQASDPDNTYLNTQVPYEKWISLVIPATKPMLPLYGEVRTWFDSTALMDFSFPPPPPAPGSPEFEADIALVRSYSDKRSREHWRIADYWADGAGTATPPGHWNIIAEDEIRDRRLNELRAARVMAAMNRAVMDGGVICWKAKYAYYFPRPSQIDPNIKTATGIPNFPSYTSGHATFSAAAATVLSYLFPDEAADILAMGEEAGLSRVVGGIHYQFDNIEGQKCGKAIGDLAIEWLRQDGAE